MNYAFQPLEDIPPPPGFHSFNKCLLEATNVLGIVSAYRIMNT